MGEAGRQLVEANRGSLQRLLVMIGEQLES
jgi:hypothetical protein